MQVIGQMYRYPMVPNYGVRRHLAIIHLLTIFAVVVLSSNKPYSILTWFVLCVKAHLMSIKWILQNSRPSITHLPKLIMTFWCSSWWVITSLRYDIIMFIWRPTHPTLCFLVISLCTSKLETAVGRVHIAILHLFNARRHASYWPNVQVPDGAKLWCPQTLSNYTFSNNFCSCCVVFK